jgi:PKD repeat protein
MNGNILWRGIYGGSEVDLCYAMIQTNDGGYALGGGSYSDDGDLTNNNGDQDFWVLKTDSLGNLLWQSSEGGNKIDVCYAIAEDLAGNIYAAGTNNSTNGSSVNYLGNYDVWVVKFSSNGNVTWTKKFGGIEYETAQSILIDSQQNIFIGGYSKSSNGNLTSNYGYGDSWIFKIDDNGNLITQKNFGGSGGDNLYSILETADGGYLLTSGTTSNDIDIRHRIGQEDIWLCKTDASLNIEWSQNYGGTGNDRPVSVIQNADGGFLIAGYTFSNNFDVNGSHGSADMWLLTLKCEVPNAFFATPANVCLDDTISFTNLSTSASEIKWTLNNALYSTDEEIKIPFTTVGTYQLILNVQTCYNSADYTASIIVTDCLLPQVSFTSQISSVCQNGSITFNDASVNSTSWSWVFPGGTPATSTLQNPVVTYSTPGIFSVILTATNNHGSQSAMKFNYVTVNAPPSAPVITQSGNEFTSSTANQYQWYFNNVEISSATDQNFYASNSGIYFVEVMDQNQCTSQSAPLYYSMTGITETNLNDFSVFPNPAADEININLPANTEGRIILINSKGQHVFDKNIEKNEISNKIDLTQYPAGMYSVVISNENGLSTKTIIKY